MSARNIQVPTPPSPRRGHLPFDSEDIEVTSRWIERGGRPWIPVTGEIHYSRLPRERWSEVLGHARAGGLDSVATYVFWAAHEPEPGRFDWSGNLDLRAFIELAAAHGLDVVVRLGPWAHGEYRNGGFPDWLLARGLEPRTNDPAYLALVRTLYGETIAQLRGLTHAEGGPIIAAQVDNELYDRPEHLAALREIAEELGLRVPVWTATGWGGAQVPESILPVFGAYADGFWEETTTEWPAFAPVHFRYSAVRDDVSVGADLREALDGITELPAAERGNSEEPGSASAHEVLDSGTTAQRTAPDSATAPAASRDEVPFVTCELGGGMHVAYHRRPLVTPEDVAAVALAKLGSGSVWQGYYMYAGGTQRTGPHGTEQESQATGYPNDVPALSYDFGAPIGEHGQIRPHHHLLRRQHLWLRADGHRLARMASHVGGGSDDPAELRWAVRSDGTSGYLFATTYQPPKRPLAPQAGVQFTVRFGDGQSVTVPSSPVDIPSGSSFVWPLRYPLTPTLELRTATAQILTRIPAPDADSDLSVTPDPVRLPGSASAPHSLPDPGSGRGLDAGPAPERGVDLVVLAAVPGVPVELVLSDGSSVELPSPPGPDCFIDLDPDRDRDRDRDRNLDRDRDRDRDRDLDLGRDHDRDRNLDLGRDRVRLLILDELSANRLYRLELAGCDRLVLADVPVYAEGGRLVARMDTPEAEVSVLIGGRWRTWTLTEPDAGPTELASDLRPEHGPAPAPRFGGPMGRLSAPDDYSGAAVVDVALPETGADRTLLRVEWTGDAGRAYDGDRLIGDHFWHGRPWDLDVTSLRSVRLELLPWRRATGVWVDPEVRRIEDGVAVQRVTAIGVKETRLTIEEDSR
ncbi:hypothetical protein GCM10009853_011750 [Glycomyces scopariae]